MTTPDLIRAIRALPRDPDSAANRYARLAVDRLEAQAARIAALETALGPFVRFARQWDRKPLYGIHDEFYGIHTGTEFEASLRLSDCREASRLLGS